MGRLHALIVQAAADQDGAVLTASLARRQVEASVVTNFHDARRRLTADPPDLLITDLKLQEYNGLHLVLVARGWSPRTITVVLADSSDEMLRAEAESLGALFVIKPLAPEQLESLSKEMLSRCWARRLSGRQRMGAREVSRGSDDERAVHQPRTGHRR